MSYLGVNSEVFVLASMENFSTLYANHMALVPQLEENVCAHVRAVLDWNIHISPGYHLLAVIALTRPAVAIG